MKGLETSPHVNRYSLVSFQSISIHRARCFSQRSLNTPPPTSLPAFTFFLLHPPCTSIQKSFWNLLFTLGTSLLIRSHPSSNMAFNNALSTRLEELRSRNPQSTASENTTGYTIPSRYSGSFMTTHSHPSNDVRASLQRRFTTDLSKMPTLTPIGQPSQVVDPVDISSTVCSYLLWDIFGGLLIVVDMRSWWIWAAIWGS